ncbi:hypothetical protein NM208_g6856 [Fusarium decemcellulare]|uniref:Uncharacterized protein n=2 Tax=Fusarium decemcellulare TaxID=57161 RepID=A0ACC1RYX7_9HYPO|nr:hypothetical protein NM208_g10135 [Fusarium decemcellulare]KAJ3536119.1 hypothetical protein NM208_g6856 [Fusarium decemcellulare]
MSTRDWQKTVAEKLLRQSEAITHFTSAELQPSSEKTNGHTTNGQHGTDYITSIDDAAILANKIASGEVTSEAVIKAYIARLTEVFFQDALTRAKELDEFYTKEGKTVGALHGVPITLKDQFNVKGYDTTLGYTSRAFKLASDDAILVSMLKQLGAIIVCKTNLPQSIMWCETENPLWGLTDNPMIPGYTPGGSTGGESALLYLHGSMLGLGTDIGGSIRIPAHMMGLYGLKPSSGRLPYTGVPVSTEGQEHVPSAIGPLARSLSSIHQMMKEVITQEPWSKDSRCAPIPWRQDIYDSALSRKLSIGVLYDDGVVKPHPAISRVLRETAATLNASGHELVDWNADLHAECIEVMDLYYTVDGGEDIRREIEAGGEPYIPHVQKLVNRGKPISVFEYWQLNKRKRNLQQAYLEKWNGIRSPTTGKPVDVLLMPVMPHSAVPHRATRWVGYTKVWNILDYTALAIPAGKVEPQDCQAPWDHTARNEIDGWNSQVWKDHKQEMAESELPVGVQLVGRQLDEEKVLAVGKLLDQLLRQGTK